MHYKITNKQKMERLRAHLREGRSPNYHLLADKLDRCGNDWKDDRYTCRSPACVRCRRRHIVREQRFVERAFGERDNDDLAMITVVLGATDNIEQVSSMIAKSREATRKRIAASRRDDPRWNGLYLTAWHEIDAAGAEHIPLLPPQRRRLVEQIAPMSFDSALPMWLPSWHGIVRLNGLSVDEVACQFRRNWKIERQVDVRPFDADSPVLTNLSRVTSYANKFDCKISLTDRIEEAWPVMWQSKFFNWLNTAQRNPFESLRMTVNQSAPTKEIDVCRIVDCIPAMPVIRSITGVPMHIYTGRP